MYGAGKHGSKSVLGRVSVVDMNERVIYDTFVKKTLPVTDYRTQFSGLTKSRMSKGIVKVFLINLMRSRFWRSSERHFNDIFMHWDNCGPSAEDRFRSVENSIPKEYIKGYIVLQTFERTYPDPVWQSLIESLCKASFEHSYSTGWTFVCWRRFSDDEIIQACESQVWQIMHTECLTCESGIFSYFIHCVWNVVI